ncbi:MAG: metal-dependent hydrolase [Rubrobacter sp.]|nr:metal-dependent hydrolase [Rubrobacter sp.]
MRTYSHAVLSWAAARRVVPSEARPALLAAAGATLPDVPAGLGGAILALRRRRWFARGEFSRDVCGRRRFSGPDAALHSLLPVSAALALYGLALGYGARRLDRRGAGLTFLLGWAGHALTDALTHGGDARPLLWPVSRWRFESPVSYWERGRHGRAFALAEHALLVLAVAPGKRIGAR